MADWICIRIFIRIFSNNSNVLVMEFKGTKGRWEARLKGQITSSVYCGNTQICLKAKSNLESKADMLLISKAPEMLEMLKDIVDTLESGETPHIYKIEQLIKEATEL